MSSVHVWLLVNLATASGPDVEQPWRRVRNEPDGLVVDARPVKDTAFPEVRVSALSASSPHRLLEAMWQRRPDGVEGNLTEHSETLRETPDERLLYIVLKPPVIGRRDYTIRYRAFTVESTGVTRVWFKLENESGPPPRPGILRMRVVRGEWVFTPRPSGGSAVTYQCVSDPAGEVSTWLAAPEQQRIAVDMVREVLRRAAQPKLRNGD